MKATTARRARPHRDADGPGPSDRLPGDDHGGVGRRGSVSSWRLSGSCSDQIGRRIGSSRCSTTFERSDPTAAPTAPEPCDTPRVELLVFIQMT